MVELGNKLISQLYKHAEPEETRQTIENLLTHIAEHFKYEEEVLANLGYQGLDEHKKIHAKLFDKALKLKEEYQSGTLNQADFYRFILDDMIIGHLLEEDVKYFTLIREKGL